METEKDFLRFSVFKADPFVDLQTGYRRFDSESISVSLQDFLESVLNLLLIVNRWKYTATVLRREAQNNFLIISRFPSQECLISFFFTRNVIFQAQFVFPNAFLAIWQTFKFITQSSCVPTVLTAVFRDLWRFPLQSYAFSFDIHWQLSIPKIQ